MDLFDSPWKILIVAVLIIVLFGSRKLPEAARSLGKSMRILKTEVQGMHEDSETQTAYTAPATTAAQPRSRYERFVLIGPSDREGSKSCRPPHACCDRRSVGDEG